jgi:hypothetical protein
MNIIIELAEKEGAGEKDETAISTGFIIICTFP